MRSARCLAFVVATLFVSKAALAQEETWADDPWPNESTPPKAPAPPPNATPPSLDAPPVAPAPKKDPTTLHVHAAGGASYATLFGIGMTSMRGEVGAVVDLRRRFAVTFGGGADLGSTDTGLRTGDCDLFFTADFVHGRLRLGGGPQISYFFMTRATGASNVEAFGLGLRAHATVDVVRFKESSAITLSIVPETEWLFNAPQKLTDGGGLFRIGATTGVRF